MPTQELTSRERVAAFLIKKAVRADAYANTYKKGKTRRTLHSIRDSYFSAAEALLG